jgi:hypothetical protein
VNWPILVTDLLEKYGLTAESPKIQAADGIGLVWRRFCDWVNDQFADNDTGILVANNGETCDLAWL